MPQNFVITVHEVEMQPVNWTIKDAWPHEGVFRVKGQDDFYHVGEWSVDYIGSAKKTLFSRPIDDSVLNPQITEDLFLKAISAAANSKLLSA